MPAARTRSASIPPLRSAFWLRGAAVDDSGDLRYPPIRSCSQPAGPLIGADLTTPVPVLQHGGGTADGGTIGAVRGSTGAVYDRQVRDRQVRDRLLRDGFVVLAIVFVLLR